MFSHDLRHKIVNSLLKGTKNLFARPGQALGQLHWRQLIAVRVRKSLVLHVPPGHSTGTHAGTPAADHLL